MNNHRLMFAPQLYIRSGIKDVSFYEKAFGALEINRWTNVDDSVHVAEFSLGGQTFHLHEDNDKPGLFSPEKNDGTSVKIGLFVDDVDAVMSNAMAAGATLISPATDYDYRYRQGEIIDPFGHHWLIEKKI